MMIEHCPNHAVIKIDMDQKIKLMIGNVECLSRIMVGDMADLSLIKIVVFKMGNNG